MELHVREVSMHYVEHGHGIPLLVLHGAGVDHRETLAAIECLPLRTGYRRIYVDLPGMGRSTATGLRSNADVVALLIAFIGRLGLGPVVLLGHSYGAYLARGVAARRPELVHALALICPLAEHTGAVPEHHVVEQDARAERELERQHVPGYRDYFVVRTPATARRYRDHVLPGAALVDEAALARIFSDWALDTTYGTVVAPTLIVAGRNDAVVGYRDAIGLLEQYPQASLAVLDSAGHALLHERPAILSALLDDWLPRLAPKADESSPRL